MRFPLTRTRLDFRTLTKRKLLLIEDGEVDINHRSPTIPPHAGLAEGRGSRERRTDLIDLARQGKVLLRDPAFTVG
jgi:hypothetical protein